MHKSRNKIRLFNLSESWYFPKYSGLLFIIILTILSFAYNFQNILTLRPQGIHQWRQCDCLSITLNYFQDGNPFLKPAMHNLAGDGTGQTASDFPGLYYFVAQLWKVFGFHEYIFRIVSLLFSFLGLFALFKTLEHILKDTFWAISGVILLYTSPMLVYYSFNFLTNVPAFSLALIAWLFFYKFYKSQNYRYFYISTFFFLMAGLLKVSALLSFIAIIATFLIEYFKIIRFKKDKKLFQSFLKTSIPILILILIISLWYFYAYFYNETHNKNYFLIGTLPIWATDNSHIHKTFLAIKEHLKSDYFNKETSYLLLAMWLSVFIFYRRANKFLLIILGLLSLGMAAFFLLFFQAFESHDYYTINLLILVPFILLNFLILLKKWKIKIFNSLFLKILFLAFLIYNINFARSRIADRYSKDQWMNENRTKYTYALETIAPYLRSIGINENDRLICLPDHSINISLYLMNQKGWTSYNIQDNPKEIAKCIDYGARYLIVYEKEGFDPLIFSQFIDKKIGQYKNTTIYNLKQ